MCWTTYFLLLEKIRKMIGAAEMFLRSFLHSHDMYMPRMNAVASPALPLENCEWMLLNFKT